MQMINKTHAGHADRCPYGRRCCGSMADLMGGKRKRRMLKRRERQSWKRELRDS